MRTSAVDDADRLAASVARVDESLRALRAGKAAAGERNIPQVRNCLHF